MSAKSAPKANGTATAPAPSHAGISPVRFLFHAVSAAVMLNGFRGLIELSKSKNVPPEYGGFFQYLTIVGLMASTFTVIASTIADLFPRVSFIVNAKRLLLLFSFPTEITISAIYWPIVLFAPSLMLPVNPDLATAAQPSSVSAEHLFFIPIWMDLSLHAVPAVALVIDFFTFEKKYKAPVSTFGAMALAVSAGSAYCAWIEHCASINGKFPYPFLTIMTFEHRTWTYAGATTFALFVFWALNAIHK